MSRLNTYCEWDGADGRHFRAVYDEDHRTVGSYGYSTDAETKAAEDREIAKLESGEWVVLGVIVSERCECAHGGHEHETASLWGIVVVNTNEAIEAFVKEVM